MNNAKKTYWLFLGIILMTHSVVWVNAQSKLINGGSKIIVNSGSSLVIEGDLVNTSTGNDAIKLSGQIILSGDFTNNATNGNLLLTTSGEVLFNGSTTQTIGGSSSIYFKNLKVDKANGSILIDKACYVGSVLTLSDGIINTSSGKELVMQAGSSVVGGSDSSHVDGPMMKIGSTDFTFPVGDGGFIEQIGIANLASSATFTAQYFRVSAPNNTQLSGNLTAVSSKEYWHIFPSSGSPQINLVLTWNSGSFSGIGNPSTLLLAHQKSNGIWEDVPYISHTGTSSNGTITVGPISSYSNFTFGTKNNVDNPLPIELLSFDAIQNEYDVDLIWKTATEINNDFFTIVKSKNGEDWITVGQVKGAGNSNSILSYKLTDEHPFMGVSYYRLIQTDFDGSETYSSIRKVEFDDNSLSNIFIFPNPTVNTINVKGLNSIAEIVLYNCLGERVIESKLKPQQTINISNLAKGVYLLVLMLDNQRMQFRVVKQ